MDRGIMGKEIVGSRQWHWGGQFKKRRIWSKIKMDSG